MRNFDRWRAVSVERFDGLEPPGLAFFALVFTPADRLPVWREDETRTGIRDFDAIAAGFIYVQEERLLDCVLVRAGFDVNTVFEENICPEEDFLTAVHGIGD